MKDSNSSKLTEGSIIKSIIFLSIPILIGNLLQTMFQITDAFWVGKLGADAVASVSICFPIVFLISALTMGMGIGGGVLVSQYKGRKDHEMVNRIVGQTFLIALVLSIVLSIIGYYFAPQMIRFFGAETGVFDNAVSFLRISFLGMIFVFGYMIYQSLARAVGDAKAPVYILLITVILNFLLDPLFIYGWKFIPAMGVGGAAFATLCTQALAFFVGIIVLSKGKRGIHLKKENFKPDYKLIKKIFFIGAPSSLEQSSRSIGMIVMMGIIASFGTVVLASYGIGGQMLMLVIIPALSLSIANSTLVGHNIGAGKVERAEKIAKISTAVGFIVLTIIGIIMFIFAKQLIGIFIHDDLAVVNEGAYYLRIMALSFGLIGIQMSLLGTIRGSGNTRTVLYVTLTTIVVQILSALILGKYILNNQLGVYLSMPISSVVGAALALIIFFKGDWKNKKILDNPQTKQRIKSEEEISELE